MINPFSLIKKIPPHFQILIGMLAGFGIGHIFPSAVPYVSPLGALFIRLLKLMVVPLLFVSILDGIAKVGSAKKLSELGLKSTVYYLATNALAVLTSLILVNLIQPGDGIDIFGHQTTVPAPSESAFLDFIPSNIFRAFLEADSLQLISIAIFFGIGVVALCDKVPALIKGLNEANELLLKLTSYIIALAPVGVFGLMAGMAKVLDWEVLIGVGKFAAVILIGLVIHGGITLSIIFKMFSDRPLGSFVKQMQPALLTAFCTSSSSATLPVTIECVEKKAKVPKEIAGFVLPVGATVNMDGTAIYEAAACLFVAQAVGVNLTLCQQLIVFVTAMLAAIGAAAIPSAGLVTLAMVLSAVHLPLEGIGFLLAIDRPLDMSRTIVNVWGDMVGCAVVEGKKKRIFEKTNF